MNRFLFTILVSLMAGKFQPLSAQGIQDFLYLKDPIQRESFISVGASRIRMANPAAPAPDNHRLSAFNLYLDLRHYRIEKGEVSVLYTNPLLTDLVLLLRNTIDNPNSVLRAEGSSLSSGPIGWLNLVWNLSGPGMVQPFLGFHHNDYFFGSTYVIDSLPGDSRITQEPQGYYFSAGPTAGTRLSAGKWGFLEARASYGFSYWRATSLSYAEVDDAYPNPHWMHLQVDFLTKWGIFTSLQHHRLLNRGNLPNTTRRWEAILGFQIMI